MPDSIADQTRKIYFKQHLNHEKDDVMFERFVRMASDPGYYHLTRQDLKGMNVLDAGCGNSGYLQVAFSRFGIGNMTCIDIGSEWGPALMRILKKHEVPLKMFDFIEASTDALPFPDNHFDMVISNGVLMHLDDMAQVERAWKELARVTKPGGYLYVLLGCPTGLLEEEILPAVRRYYARNKDFKQFIDTQTPETWQGILRDISATMQKHTGESFDPEAFRPLFDLDLCTFLQNVLQVPKRYIVEQDEAYALDMFKKLGFDTPKRCRRYVVRKNLRKFLAPLHFGESPTLARLLYGPGSLEYIAQKLPSGA
ncbi:MAG: class I SAM-dependent methyltransferase [Magnetococcus sp. WYHC-3]